MAETQDPDHLSIGEVLGLLLEEFPDVTISKIRFLESQGLIQPERTPSGYRKFYEPDVDLLRVILTEQRQNYLPLRVIRDRLETGEIDPTGEHLRPSLDDVDDDPTPTEVPRASIASHPASRRTLPPPPPVEPQRDPEPRPAQLLPGILLDRGEFLSMVGITEDELDQLEGFGLVQPHLGGLAPTYDDDAVAIAKPAVEFLRAGIDARHLRTWRTAAEREASLYEQIVTPRYRQRNPEARADALRQLRRLDALGASLRSALTRQVLRHHFES